MSETKTYSAELKAQVMSALLAGQSVSSIAKEYQLPKGTVSGWKYRARETLAVTATQKSEIGALLLDYLRAALSTLKTQAVFFGEQKWLAKQEASQVAILHGVLADKAVRLLEAWAEDDETIGAAEEAV